MEAFRNEGIDTAKPGLVSTGANLALTGANAIASFFDLIMTNPEKAAEMAANMKVGSEAINSTIDSMANGAKYLDAVWKGDTKETFMNELDELQKLVNENADTLKELGNEIEKQTRISAKMNSEKTKEANNVYY